jgi:PAS domain S-box-containing protein
MSTVVQEFRPRFARTRLDAARSKLRLPPALAAGFVGVCLVLVLAFLATLANLRSVYDTAGAVSHTHEVIAALQRLIATAVDTETGERGYLITGIESYLEPYDRARADLLVALAQAKALTVDNQAQQDDVSTLQVLTERKLAELSEAIRQRRESGLSAAQLVVHANVGNQTMDAMRAVVSNMEERELALVRQRTNKASREYRQAVVASSLTVAFCLLALMCLFLGSTRLADERRRAARLAERLRVTLRSIGDGVIVTDSRGCVVELNPVAETLTGWTATEAAGRSIADVFNLVHAQTREPAEIPVGRVLRDGVIAGLANHTVLIARDAQERPIDDSAAPIRSRDGTITGAVMVFRDVTERYRAEQDRAALAEADHEARLRAESDSRAKDDFLAMLGHELRNPLSPIMTALHVMKLRDHKADERERLIIERQARHLTRLVEDLLDVSRVTQDKLELDHARVEMATVINSAVEMCTPLLEMKGHSLALELPSSGLSVSGDATRLRQIVSNLLNNAAKYTPAGGSISLQAARSGANVVVRVRDTGIGIAPEALERIFDLFVQEHSTLSQSEGGLGLGLTIVKRLVAAHNGSIEAHSAGIGAGSEFVVCIPAYVHA